MSLKKYLAAINSQGAVSETALYTPLATHILSGVLHYPPKSYAINKSGAKGTPDVRILSGADGSEWIVCEAKLEDDKLRKEKERRKLWREQILKRGYIRAETFYIMLCAPRTFYVCDLDGGILDGKRAVTDVLPLLLDFPGELVDAELVHKYLDARLVDVVAAAVLVVDAHDRFDIAQEIAAVDERPDGLRNERSAAEPATDHHLEAGLALRILVQA